MTSKEDARDTLQSVPEVGPRPHSGVQELIKVLVVAEDDMAAHVKEEALWRDICAGQSTSLCCLQHQHQLHQHFSLQSAPPIPYQGGLCEGAAQLNFFALKVTANTCEFYSLRHYCRKLFSTFIAWVLSCHR